MERWVVEQTMQINESSQGQTDGRKDLFIDNTTYEK